MRPVVVFYWGMLLTLSFFVFIFLQFVYVSENLVVPAGVYDDPYQKKISGLESWTLEGYDIVPLAEYEVKARVLSRKNYDDELGLSPVDFALGWGDMANLTYLKGIKITQGNRRYTYSYFDSSLSRYEIRTHSSNHHIVPANDNVSRIISKIHENDFVYLKGYLIEIKSGDRSIVKSSLTRDDQYDGACEVLWVEEASIIE